jgi:hypothetical protein
VKSDSPFPRLPRSDYNPAMKLMKGIAGSFFFVAAVICGAMFGYWIVSVLLLLCAGALIRGSQA